MTDSEGINGSLNVWATPEDSEANLMLKLLKCASVIDWRISWPLMILFVLVPAHAFGQGYYGTVSVSIVDQSGAAIPNAKLALIDQEKGYRFEASSDTAGRYLFRSVAPGLYTVAVAVSGFEKNERKGIRMDVGENATVDMSLKVASSSETVEVKSQNLQLQAQDATTGLVVKRNFINDLPLVDRYVMNLSSLTAGVTEADDQCSAGCTGTNFVSNGSRNSTADVLMDGATITNYEPNGGVTQVDLHSAARSGGRVPRSAIEFQRGIRLFRRLCYQHGHTVGNQ